MRDVFERAPLVAALMLRPDGGQLVVRGQLGTEMWEQTLDVPPVTATNGAIAALYGRERAADVEANALFTSVDGEVEELGLVFQIATRMTSWVAVDETRKVTGPTRDELVPQELPYGTRAAAFGLRAAMGQPAAALGEASFGAAAGGAAEWDEEASVSMPMFDKAARYDADDRFESFADEEPTGSNAPRGTGAPPAPAAPREQPMVTRSAVAQEFAKQAKLEANEPVGRAPVPRQAGPFMPEPMVDLKVARRAEAKPAPMQRAKSKWPWFAAIIAMLIALLVWWLLA
jgi:Ca-activated chloride channel family protein